MASMRFQLLGLFGIVGLLSTLSAAAVLEVRTIPKILATCGENVTLTCDAITDGPTEITEFTWKDNKDICSWGTPSNLTDIQCMNTTATNFTSYNYSLTIYNIQPKHKATYHCQVRQKSGPVRNGQTIVRVQKCVGNSTTGVTSTNGTCRFQDVFPKPDKVNWTQGGDDLNSLSSTQVTQNSDGLSFTVVSTIKLRKNPAFTGQYTCSLLVPTENEMNQTISQIVRSLSFSGADSIIAHWLGVMLAMVLGMLMVQA
ncbi:hypothetical protein NL108_013882 [Boleophthalmus pectinirostris]|uniref:uncharacterized protein LOC110160629 n=1 Tax=Boleophthalmus pectinirostris TaxID=150288 RepID=UPI000A1C3207|nr:uncharacterized protein LOC110160629 [Boleophthalmus pectinirostris]KAJ0058384.1 hypothetical protein NL108_013882 [Boleophthalmus pectinirostris]